MKFTTALINLALLLTPALVLADAPIKNDGVSAADVVLDKYIVKFMDGADGNKKKKQRDDIDKKAKTKKKNGVTDTFDIPGLSGYVVEVAPADLPDILKSDVVEYVEKDTYVNHTAVAAPVLDKRAFTTQSEAPWGLGRISHRGTGSSDYYYDKTAGSGVRVYVIDTGILTSHSEFGTRAVWGANFISGSPNTDEYGHGTHVAGTIGGKTYGVAKKCTLVAVKILDKTGSGTMSGLLAGINWAVSDAKSKGVAAKSVINMSVGGSYTASVNAGVQSASNAGLTVVVSAGNSNADASGYSPASSPSAITVAAVEGTDYRAWFSNYGTLVDIFAPGVSVLSSYIGSNSATVYMSGTSMASPHVAGLAAYFIGKEGLTGAAVTNRMIGAATTGTVGNPNGSPSRVAYNANGL
ncbi:peptidase S8/S53 domain-containing protein [Diplogelasinospora grovesii]|uniref:Peptidase S8/S53 domain-containing protein n=1 Tax=Diplogelasinospora grovesii TaxID=303347 RepID=A0AAN6MW14_9PEZI|nr:peptidase S8/S53 domain-containing protein [Diplogelasinospora grovesii]